MTSVDIIIPVYGAADDLERCLSSVAHETDLARHGVILVVDGPQDARVEEVVNAFPPARVLRNEQRLGFVQSVNRGMALSTNDVVLLNSDTIVTPRWLEKLIEALHSSTKIGTVTPLSNHATLVSVPRAFEENLLPTGFDAASLAALIERVSRRAYVPLPTAVGVCMVIRRAVLDEIGLFDAKPFGLGYGEENDFCMRATAKGWLHIADDATFIYHAGHRSFGASRAKLQKRAARRLDRLHPAYRTAIARFMKEDPLAPVRVRIVAALGGIRHPVPRAGGSGSGKHPPAPGSHRPAPTTRSVVHLVHGWPPFEHAGTELYAYWLVRRQLQHRQVSVYTRLAGPARDEGEAVELMDEGARVRFVTNNFTRRNPLARNAIRDRALERDFARFLREERPQLVHIHHLAGHAFSLAHVARRMGIPIVHQIQDWWSLCARVNLFDAKGRRCTGPGIAKCAACAPLTGIPPAPLWNRVLHRIRRWAARRALATADAYVMGSEAIRKDYEALLPRDAQMFVLPYGIELEPRHVPRPPALRPLRFGFVGSVMPHKGLHVADEAFRGIDPSTATLHAWGNTSASPEYASALRSVSFEGTFDERDKASVFASMDVLIVPSIGLESFGLAAREAMASGVPVIATADGALTESGAELFPSADAAALRRIVLRFTESPELVDALSRKLPRPKSMAEHAEQIEAVYARVLGR